MLRRLVAKCVKWALKEAPHVNELPAQSGILNNLSMSGPVVTVWSISNGYLVSTGLDPRTFGSPTITYVSDLNNLSAEVATLRARSAIGVSPSVKLDRASNVVGAGTYNP